LNPEPPSRSSAVLLQIGLTLAIALGVALLANILVLSTGAASW